MKQINTNGQQATSNWQLATSKRKAKRLNQISLLLIAYCLLLIAIPSCKSNNSPNANHQAELVKDIYTCSMHPEILLDKPGNCPICGMTLVKKETGGQKTNDIALEALLKPANEFVVSRIPVTTIQKKEEQIEIEALGNISYDTRQVGSISSKVAGRIEKLYVRFRYQKITSGQHILDIYSPELQTAQQNLLFLLKSDPGNTTFIQAAKDRLLFLGMSNSQLQLLVKSGVISPTIAVYSNYTGHIHDAASGLSMNKETGKMKDIALLTEELSLKEGMYLQKGQTIFSVYNPERAWVILNIYGQNQAIIKKGNTVRVVPETAPGEDFRAVIDFIEPFYQQNSKTLTARVYFNNAALKIPIGSQVRAIVFGNTKDAYWLPQQSVLSLGRDKVVFEKINGGFKAHKINTGITNNNQVQVLDGISETDSVAVNAQYLMDSESFIKIK